MFNNFFFLENRGVFYIKYKNMVDPGKTQMTM
jgi:hypothetical protein